MPGLITRLMLLDYSHTDAEDIYDHYLAWGQLDDLERYISNKERTYEADKVAREQTVEVQENVC